MYYAYILLSSKSHTFYFGSTNNLRQRVKMHNAGEVFATKPGRPWTLTWYGSFETEREARDFERYLKSGSGKAFAYKRLISGALARDIAEGRTGIPKPKA